MKEEVFVYKCPSCGGKVEYDNDKHLWNCTYCNNSYEALFQQVEKELPSIEEVEIKAYGYICSKCGNKYVSMEKDKAKCAHCDEINESGEEFIITNMINKDKSENIAIAEYTSSLNRFKKFLPQEFMKTDLKCEFVNCDLYNGCVKVSYGNKSLKYIFINLLIPNLEYDDYRFMYEVGNAGLKNTKAFHNDKDTILSKIINNGDSFYSFEDKKYEEEIVNQCVESFMTKYGITNKNDIKVEKSLKIKDGSYIPIYINEIDYNNKKYCQYNFGTVFASDNSRRSFFRHNDVIFSFPEEANSRKLTKLYHTLSASFLTLAIILMIFNFLMFIFNWYYNAQTLIFAISIPVIIVSYILNFIFRKSYDYYLRTIKISENEYFNQIINNSNYVKVIEVKK